MTIIYILITIMIISALIGLILIRKGCYDAPLFPFLIALFCFIGLLIGWGNYGTRHREYEEYMRRRTVFTSTLNNSREHGRDMEAAAIIKDVIAWNQQLAKIQYSMTRPLIGEYYDERFKNIKPIE